MTKVYFVRHAQPEHEWEEDRTRPLTEEGKNDSVMVLNFFKNKKIDTFYCSPYKRSLDTIADTASYFEKEIITDERLREREKGPDGNNNGMFQKRWANHNYHEENGESIAMVQKRNIEALNEILATNFNNEIVIGTHGTALSSILNFYDNSFGCEDFLRIIDWMPYIIELDFEGNDLVGKHEHCYVEKEFKGKQRADKKLEQEVRDSLEIKEVTIIYLDDCMILSKKIYSNWMEVQEEYYDKYKANLSPMTCDEVIQFFEEDFKEEENWPFSRNDIVDFFNSDDLVIYSYDK